MRTWAKTMFLILPLGTSLPGPPLSLWNPGMSLSHSSKILGFGVCSDGLHITSFWRPLHPYWHIGGGVKPPRHANTVMETCSGAMGGFMQNQFLNRANVVQRCKKLEKLVQGKTCHSKNQDLNWGHFLSVSAMNLPHQGSRISPTLWPRGHRPISSTRSLLPLPIRSVHPHVPLCW